MISKTAFRSEFRRALKGSSMLYLYGTFMGFLVGILLARTLGVAGYGLYGSTMAAASLGATLAAGGIQLHATREMSIQHARSDFTASARLFRWSIKRVGLLSSFAAVIVGIYVIRFQNQSIGLIGAATTATLFMSFAALSGAVLRGAGSIILGQALTVAILPTIQSALLLLMTLSVGNLTPTTALLATGLAFLLTIPVGFQVMFRVWALSQSNSQPNQSEERQWARAASTMGLTTAIRAAEAALPLMLIGALANLKEAGLYRVAASAMVLPNMAGTMLTVMVPAIASRLYERREIADLRVLSANSCVAMSIPTLCIVLVLWFIGDSLLRLAFGVEFQAAWATMIVLAMGTVVSATGGISIALLHAARKEGNVTLAFVWSIVISIGGGYWLAPEHGALGVGFAVLTGVVIRTLILAISAYKVTMIDPTLLGSIRMLLQPRTT